MHRFRRSIALPGLSAVLMGAVLAVPVAAQPRTSRPPARTSTTASEFRGVRKSAAAIDARIAAMGRLSPARATALLVPVKKQLHAWASRHHVNLVTKKVPATRTGNGPVAATVIVILAGGQGVDCNPDQQPPGGHSCTLVAVDKEPTEVTCVYECPDPEPTEM